jgi:IS30 family transposase
MDYEGMERSKRSQKKRTKIYYCHPYSSWERGSNENQNKFVRRKIPKGTNFDDKTQAYIDRITDWINNYPRGIFGFKTAERLYNEEIEKLLGLKEAM